jgi:hypothetical protein
VTAAKPTPRKVVPLRLRPEAIAEVDKCAEIEERTRSDMLRLLIAEGLKVYKRRQEMR